MKIRMTKTERGSVDGCKVAIYEAGTDYDLSASAGARDLARAFVEGGFAVEVDAKAPVKAVEPEPVEPVVEPAAPQPEQAPDAAVDEVAPVRRGPGRKKK